MQTRQDIADWLDEHQARFTAMSDEIWDNPELQFVEFKASKLQADFLAAEGFRIEWDIGGLSTAFAAEWGNGKPVIAFAGEYDALPGLSQRDQNSPDPLEAGGPGHGCGHNLLGTGCLAAALAFKEWLKSTGRAGTVRYYGCPAEEGGSGKVFMGRAGAFDDLDATFNWHPWYINTAMKGSMLSVNRYYFRFHGKTAHAAADPHSGRSALDALELMNIGVNYLREHVTDDVRLHYAILSGGLAPNVVPDFAESYYYVRANEAQTLDDVSQRVIRIAHGAAMMTDTQVEVVYKSGSTRVLSNEVLADLQYEMMRELGGIDFSDEEQAYAAAINEHFGDANVRSLVDRYGVDADAARQGLIGDVLPSRDKGYVSPGSTDMGDMSWYAPCSMLQTATWASRAAAHSWGVVATGRTSIGHKGMMFAAKVMALAAGELVLSPDRLANAQAEFQAAIERKPYVCPIPDEVNAPRHEHPLR
ncbi:MAG: amidohydrolase [Chloroflexi bacterium]|nr:amidohydrolase [Chloroflexota bacterium]